VEWQPLQAFGAEAGLYSQEEFRPPGEEDVESIAACELDDLMEATRGPDEDFSKLHSDHISTALACLVEIMRRPCFQATGQ